MLNWGAIEQNARALAVIEAAVQLWGRNSCVDWPAKLAVIVAKSDANSLSYVIEALYTQLWRRNVADPYGVTELGKVIPEILWARSYARSTARQYSALFKSPTDPADKHAAFTLSLVHRFLDSPPSHSL